MPREVEVSVAAALASPMLDEGGVEQRVPGRRNVDDHHSATALATALIEEPGSWRIWVVVRPGPATVGDVENTAHAIVIATAAPARATKKIATNPGRCPWAAVSC